MIHEEIRSYEVSLWTLQDAFISVLKWSNVENTGTIENPKMILSDDGTQNFTFSIPMYIYQVGKMVENPIWYNTRNGNLMVNLRKIKVTFNKENYSVLSGEATARKKELYDLINSLTATARDYIFELMSTYRLTVESELNIVTTAVDAYTDVIKENRDNIVRLLRETYAPDRTKKVFEFLITKITEEHESDHLMCNVECEGLAFHELGKIGYRYDLSQANVEYDYEKYQKEGFWLDHNKNEIHSEPTSTIDYWCDKIGLDKYPTNDTNISSKRWYYKVQMDWSSFSDVRERASDKMYEDEHATSWEYNEDRNDLIPSATEKSKEKERIVEVKESNIYNITQKIAETFEVYCKYEYLHDDNNHITGRVIIFFNNYIHDNNQDIMSFTYPYSSSKVSRESDSTDIVTKLYVKSMEDSTTYLGEASIAYCKANKMQEDYILNFDYLKEVGGINEDQYALIAQYEVDMHKCNEELYPLENDISFYENEIIELEAKKTVYETSVKLDKEQKQNNSDFAQNLGENGIITRDDSTPDTAIITQDDQGNYCINLSTKNKGIHTDTLQIFRVHNSAAAQGSKLSEPISGFSFVFDDYGNPTRIYGIAPDSTKTQPNMVYMSYQYEPRLYYDNIAKSWEEKLAVDNAHLNDILLRLGTDEKLQNNQITQAIYDYFAPLLGLTSTFAGSSNDDKNDVLLAYNAGLKHQLQIIKVAYENKLNEKQLIIKEFNEMMGPALREGYWQPEDYQDYGERHSSIQLFEINEQSEPMDSELEDTFEVGWDTKLFDEEQNIYYESGLNENNNKVYYPCVNLSSFMNNTHFKQNLSKYSFIFNNNYYNNNADKTKLSNTRSFSIGSEAILGFVKNSQDKVFPALILVGAKNMTVAHTPWSSEANDPLPQINGGTIGFMKDPDRGNPRIGILDSTIDNANVTMSITNDTRLNDNSYFTFDGDNIEDCQVVFPRIRFTSLMLKTSEDNLFIHYNDTLLKNYDNYYIRNRSNSTNHKPEILITLKPEVMISEGILTGEVQVDYALSNAGTAIYLDAKEIAKENAYPKVSYTIDPNILDRKAVSELYNKLNWLVMINDVQLKFKDIFGYISKLELDLDHPDKDTIEVKNYKTKFEDLFSSIIASTEAMQANSKMLSSLSAGTYNLQGSGLTTTLESNISIFGQYVDEHLKESGTLEEILENLFNDAGAILGATNQALNNVTELASKNSAILSNFATQISEELAPHIFRQQIQPGGFKQGDIWIQTDATGHEVARYLATANASDSKNGYGWIRTNDGSLAQIQGAHMDIDTAGGKIDILAQTELNLKAGQNGTVNIAAGMDVNITGNRSVNIGGTTINIGSTSIGGTDKFGGINLIATGITSNQFNETTTAVSKVLIHPDEISMYGSKITMGIGVLDSNQVLTEASVLSLDPDTGIYLGSSKGIHFFSEKLNANPRSASTVDIDSTQISLGVIGANSGTVVALKQDVIILGAANSVTDLQTNKVTWTSTITGVTITPSAMGLAAMNGNTRSAVIMNGDGVMIGSVDTTNQGDINTQGAYVKILSSGVIDIGGTGNLNINNSNMYLNANASSGTVFELKHTNNNTTTSYIKYTADGKLYLTADQITLGSQTVTAQTGFEMTPAQIWAGVKSATSGNTTALTITDSSLNLDVNSNNYVHISTAGIDMKGQHILINGKQEWSRDDIIFSQNKPNGPTDGRAWVWIKPMSISSLTYSSVNGGINKTGYKAVDIYTSSYNYFATSSTTVYTYKITIVMHMNYSDESDAVFVWLATNENGAGVQFIGKAVVPFGYYAQGRSQTSTVTFVKDLTGQNFCSGSSTYALIKVTDPGRLNQNYNYNDVTSNENIIKPSSHYVIESVTLEAICPQDTTGAAGVPCDVYYYSATHS